MKYAYSVAFVACLAILFSLAACDSSPTRVNAVASFTADCLGLDCKFNNRSTGATAFKWTFGDLRESGETDPIHTYLMGGRYQPRLVACPDTDFNSERCDTSSAILIVRDTSPTLGTSR